MIQADRQLYQPVSKEDLEEMPLAILLSLLTWLRKAHFTSRRTVIDFYGAGKQTTFGGNCGLLS